jgi:hypothetical protein
MPGVALSSLRVVVDGKSDGYANAMRQNMRTDAAGRCLDLRRF